MEPAHNKETSLKTFLFPPMGHCRARSAAVRSALLAASALAPAFSVHAQSSLTIYGIVDQGLTKATSGTTPAGMLPGRAPNDDWNVKAGNTSRLGFRARDVLEFYVDKIEGNEDRFQLKMLHIFLNKGIKDDIYYWSELNKVINLYCQLKKICPELDSINIGGGFPIKHSLGFEYDYQFMINEIVGNIKKACKRSNVPMPNIFTEFGSYTVGESMAHIYSVIGQKMQNDREIWYMIDSSFITTLPDTWGIGERFLMLPINKWDVEYQRVVLGGITCDSHDYYDSEEHINEVFLPKVVNGEPLYVGFFHTGAYQDQISGYGGIKHCLIPSPKHVIVGHDKNGKLTDWVYAKEQTAQSMLKILGYL